MLSTETTGTALHYISHLAYTQTQKHTKYMIQLQKIK